MDVNKIDKNFDVKNIVQGDIKFFDAESSQFRIYGLMRENGIFCRMPKVVADSVNEGVAELYAHSAGGRIRFVTNSKRIAIKAKMPAICKFPHFTLAGTAGFDIYIKKDGKDIYYKTFMPPYDIVDGYESEVSFENEEIREITINFPLYSCVEKLYIGLCENSMIERAPDYKTEKPVVFYGSSITQGGCASRPGNSYQAIFSRELDCNYINLGFSGSARGEDEIADYIKSLDMTALVYDYDYNAPTAEHLKLTHKRMFDIIRSENPQLPILILSKPKYHLTQDDKKRLEIIRETYEAAKSNGDENVYFIAGNDLIDDEIAENWSVDDCHPNDSGFVAMARGVIGIFKEKLF